MNLIEIIKNAVRLLFGQSKVITSLKNRIAELEAVNEGLRNSHAMDTVSLRKAAEAAATDLKAAKARESDLAGQLTVLDDAGRELLAAVNENADLPIYDPEFNLIAVSGVTEPAPKVETEVPTPAAEEAPLLNPDQLATGIREVPEPVAAEAEDTQTEPAEVPAESEAVAVAEAPEIAVSDANQEPSES